MTAPRDLTPVHDPVMVDRVVEVFAAAPAGVHVDATLGDGGHAAAVLEANPALSLVGIDRDPDAIAASTVRLAPFGDRVSVRQARFDQIGDVVEDLGVTEVSGVLFDFGISSRQVNEAHRGFSYRSEGPLDMRMGQGDDPADAEVTADDIVNTWPEEDLSRLLSRLGDEPRARAIARAVVAARPLHTTTELAAVISEAVPAAVRRKGHPARKTFQALRIEVNEELDQIPAALEQALDLLVADGRAAAIAYHSGEDRIVKSDVPRGVHRWLHLPARRALRLRCRTPGRPAQAGGLEAHRRRDRPQPPGPQRPPPGGPEARARPPTDPTDPEVQPVSPSTATRRAGRRLPRPARGTSPPPPPSDATSARSPTRPSSRQAGVPAPAAAAGRPHARPRRPSS